MENNILYDKQFGFRKGHSTRHAIITMVNKVSKSLDKGKIVGGVYLDIRKAFDSISHQILLDKLHKIGIRGNIHCLLKSYLMYRSQYVICNGAKSDVKFVESGVPQGSIMGPLLFILFMNDFFRSSTLLFSILFADDTSVFLEGTEYSKLIKTLNIELENVTKWLNANRLTVNMKKTHYIIFHRAKFKTTGQDVVMQNSALTCVTTTKFFLVIIDHKFKWNDHITYVKSKISKSIGILYKIPRFLDMNTLIQMYHSFVFPYLIYCVEIWGNASAIHLDPLIKIRAITFSEFSAPSEPLFLRTNILNFDNLVFQRICLMMFKHHIDNDPKPISDLFQTNDNYHSYSTLCIYFRRKMSSESTVWGISAPSENQIGASCAKTHRLLLASFRHAKHKSFKKHMDDNVVQHNFDGSLAYGIKLVMSIKRSMSDVAPTLKILLQYGAK